MVSWRPVPRKQKQGREGEVQDCSHGSCSGVGVAGEQRWLACKVGMAMLHHRPIIVQGEQKDEKEKERLIKVCCKACVGGYSGVATVSVGG